MDFKKSHKNRDHADNEYSVLVHRSGKRVVFGLCRLSGFFILVKLLCYTVMIVILGESSRLTFFLFFCNIFILFLKNAVDVCSTIRFCGYECNGTSNECRRGGPESRWSASTAGPCCQEEMIHFFLDLPFTQVISNVLLLWVKGKCKSLLISWNLGSKFKTWALQRCQTDSAGIWTTRDKNKQQNNTS